MSRPTTSTALAYLAFRLSQWVDGERAEYCQQWAAYWQSGEGKPSKGPHCGQPLKDSDFFVFCEALAVVKFGWISKAEIHLQRVNRRMSATPVLTRFPLAARVGAPQVRDGKQ